ncbi:MAG: hypothetical protein H6R14_2062 [Proteobacteria bacterium]|nr:hypothetical protein [Pseudomonadota bacterium]
MTSPIIARADALMHRRRQNENDIDDIPVLTDSVDQMDDIPVLIEVETPPEMETPGDPEEAVEEPVSDYAEEEVPEDDADDHAELREQIIRDLTSRIEERIKAALPEILSSTIREYLAEHEQASDS